jgi:hypothetical protein
MVLFFTSVILFVLFYFIPLGYVPVQRYSRTRPSISTYVTNIAVLIASRKSEVLESRNSASSGRKRKRVCPPAGPSPSEAPPANSDLNSLLSVGGVDLCDFYLVEAAEFPIDAAYY